jgi:membrane protein implicated in regulation of membrane protease activity
MNTLFLLWGIGSILLIGLELSFPGLFFFLSLALGSLSAALVSLGENDITYQLIVCVLVTFISFFVLRYWARSRGKDTLAKTNVYALQGKQGVVTEPISRYQRGWISIQGELWAAHAEESDIIQKGEIVEVTSVKGAHLIVKRIKTP